MLNDEEKKLIFKILILGITLILCITFTIYKFTNEPMFCINIENKSNYNTLKELNKECFFTVSERNERLREINAGAIDGHNTD